MKETFEIDEFKTVYFYDEKIGRENPKNPAIIYSNGIVEYWKDGLFVKVGFLKS